MSNPKTLTVAQLLVLTTAAQRSDHLLLPLPAELRVRGGAQRNLLAALLKMNLVEEFPIEDASVTWRTDEGDQHLALRLTTAGFVATGIPGSNTPASSEGAEPLQAPTSGSSESAPADAGNEEPATRSPIGKLGQVLEAISAEAGATLSEITALTNWLPHTARAAVTGLRHRGFPIHLVEHDGRKAYRRVVAG